MSLEIPLGEQEHLKEFFELAEQHFKDDRLKSYEKLISYIDSMEQQCTDMREEIEFLKEQLQDIEGNRLKGKMDALSKSIYEQLLFMGMNIRGVKKGISDQIQEMLAGLQHGRDHVLERLFSGLQVKEHLENVRGYLKNVNQTLETGLRELEQAGRKKEEVKAHKREAMAVFMGKEVKTVGKGYKEGVLQKTLKYIKNLCERMEQKTVKMIQVIEKDSNVQSEKQKTDWKSKIHPKTGKEVSVPERGR